MSAFIWHIEEVCRLNGYKTTLQKFFIFFSPFLLDNLWFCPFWPSLQHPTLTYDTFLESAHLALQYYARVEKITFFKSQIFNIFHSIPLNRQAFWNFAKVRNHGAHRRFRGIECRVLKICDFKKVILSLFFKHNIAGLCVLIPKRYHMLG